jgi:hypothetical protein
MMVCVTTEHNTDVYSIRLNGLFMPLFFQNGKVVWMRVPQPFAVMWHILRKRGVYKNARIKYG